MVACLLIMRFFGSIRSPTKSKISKTRITDCDNSITGWQRISGDVSHVTWKIRVKINKRTPKHSWIEKEISLKQLLKNCELVIIIIIIIIIALYFLEFHLLD